MEKKETGGSEYLKIIVLLVVFGFLIAWAYSTNFAEMRDEIDRFIKTLSGK